MGVDFIALSFVRRREDLAPVRAHLGDRDIPLIAKIEKPAAAENAEEIIMEADGVMVARGDLGVEIDQRDGRRRDVRGGAALARAAAGHHRPAVGRQLLEPVHRLLEVVHLPEGRLGNILCRPVLRDFEIPYLGSDQEGLRLAAAERRVPVRGNRHLVVEEAGKRPLELTLVADLR